MTVDELEVLRRVALFSGMPREALLAIAGDSHAVQVERGSALFRQGDPADRFYVVFSGWIKLVRTVLTGDEVVVSLVARGESFAEAAMFDTTRFPVTAEVIEDARLLVIPGQPFLDRVRQNPALALNMLASLSRRMRGFIGRIEQLQSQSAPQRLADFLVRLASTSEGAARVRLPIDKSLIAGRLGMKPETFSRALMQLRRAGVRVDDRDVIIGDVSVLRRMGGQGD